MKSNWLRERRRQLNLSQEELVTRLELEGQQVSRALISHWETGRNNPPLDDPNFRAALANALRMSLLDILIAAGYEITDDPRSEAIRRAATMLEQLSPEQRELVLSILEQFVKANYVTQVG